MRADMTDEAMSELAEALADACEASIRAGIPIKPIRSGNHVGCSCPFGALLYPGKANSYPDTTDAERIERAGLLVGVVVSFTKGFDGFPPYVPIDDDRAYALGKQAREQYGRRS